MLLSRWTAGINSLDQDIIEKQLLRITLLAELGKIDTMKLSNSCMTSAF